MPFRIDPRKPFDDEIRRAGLELIDEAIEILENQPDGSHEAVHDARKRFKRIRALYRLIQPANAGFRREENARFRQIAQSLAFARDATALVETAGYLEEFARSEAQSVALQSVIVTLEERRDHAIEHEVDLDSTIKTAIAQCRKGRAQLDALSLPEDAKDATRLIRKSWAKQRRKALEALSDCHAHADVEHFHDLRKAGQIYWMHLGLLRRLWPSAMRSKRADAKRLVDLLGREHDLSVLAALADREGELFGNGVRQAFLLEAIIRQQQVLRKNSLALAGEVFSESARTESSIAAVLWRRAGK